MSTVSIFDLTRFTALAAGDILPAVDISDSTQSAHGSVDGITIANFFGTIPSPLAVTAGTVTVSTPVFSATETWNAGGVAFTGIKLNITNTASAAGSKLLDLQVASTSKFSVSSTGVVLIGDGALGTPSLAFASDPTTGIYAGGLDDLVIGAGGTLAAQFTASSITFSLPLSVIGTANSSVIGLSGYSLTGTDASSAWNLTGTWNTSGNPTLIKANVTNTASGASSLLMDLQASTVSKFSVSKGGVVTATTFVGNVTGNVTGNADTATKLATARAINGVNFDGSAAITVPAAAGTLTGTTLASNVVTSSLTTIGTLVGGAVPASLVTAGTLGSGNFTLSGTAILTATTVTATNLGGTLSTAAQPNITSVGTLTSLTMSGALSGVTTLAMGGALTGVTTIATSSTINSQTISSSASFTGSMAITGALSGVTTLACSNTITSTIGSISASTPVWSGTQTWNAGGTSFKGVLLNVTNTASAVTSVLYDYQVGSTTVSSLRPNGQLNLAASTTAGAEYLLLNMTAASGSAGHAFQRTTGVASATTIGTTGSVNGVLAIVTGTDGTNIFCDLIITGGTGTNPTTISSKTVASSPAVRTYTASGTNVQLAMASGTYTVSYYRIGVHTS